jgi:hypothetical protein
MKRVSGLGGVWFSAAGLLFAPLVINDATANGLKDAFERVSQSIQTPSTQQQKPAPTAVPVKTATTSSPASSAGATGTTLNHPDIGGIVLGGSDPGAVRAAVKQWKGNWLPLQESKEYIADPTSTSGEAIPNTTYVSKLENPGTDKGALSMTFAKPPSKSVVLNVTRMWAYARDETNTPAQYLSALKAKYGENSYEERLTASSIRYTWAYTKDGTAVHLGAQHPCVSLPTSSGRGGGNDSAFAAPFVKAGCASRTVATIEIGNGVVTNSTVAAMDFAGMIASEDATKHFIEDFVASKTKKMQEGTKSHAGTAL